MPTTIYEVTLPGGRVVKLRELSVGDFEAALRVSNNRGGGTGLPWEVTNEGLRRAIVSDADKPVTYTDLAEAALGDRFGLKGLMLLRSAFDKIHTPSEEETKLAGEMRVTVQG